MRLFYSIFYISLLLLANSCSYYSTETKINTILNRYEFTIQPKNKNDIVYPKVLSKEEKSEYLDSLKIILKSIDGLSEINEFILEETKKRSVRDSNYIVITILLKDIDYLQRSSYGIFAIVTDREKGVLLYKSSIGEKIKINLNKSQIINLYKGQECNHFYLERYYRECGNDLYLIFQDHNFSVINSYLYTCVSIEDNFKYSEDFLCIARLRNMLLDDIIYNSKRKINE